MEGTEQTKGQVRRCLDMLRSKRLALGLMVTILAAILVGVLLPEQTGQRFVFHSLWFNALLVLLVVNTASCFFSRIRQRRLTLISAGMILFHLSFVSVFVGVVSNNLLYFQGIYRLTEGETLGLDDPSGYDYADWGRFFKHSWMRGMVTYHKLHDGYVEEGRRKGASSEISIVDGIEKKTAIIYPTKHIEFKGFKIFPNQHGFSPLIVLYDRSGKEVFGAYSPLQSFPVAEKSYLMSTGTKNGGPGSIDFPQVPNMPPMYRIQAAYLYRKAPGDPEKAAFKVWEYDPAKENKQGRLVYDGEVPVGEKAVFGEHALLMRDVRYWSSMAVVYNPGTGIVLTSLWVGMVGLIITAIGRFRNRKGEAPVADAVGHADDEGGGPGLACEG